MSVADRFALLICALAVLASFVVAGRVFENMAHLEDEYAYLWQAQIHARGDLTLSSPEVSRSFVVPFVVDYGGQRFGKYPLGWPALLSLGVRLDARGWVNPLLAGLAVWLIYRLGTRLASEAVGLLAAGLTLISPFFLMNTGSLLSHPWSLVLASGFMLSWIEGVAGEPRKEVVPPWLPLLTCGLSLGLLGVTRPLTMVGVAVPFGIHGLYLLWRGDRERRRRVWMVGGIAFLLTTLHFFWQLALTGQLFKNPYTLWWPYDRIGFGPGHGVMEGGHTLKLAWWNTKHSLRTGMSDLFGWPKLSWLFLPLGLWALRKNRDALLVGAVAPSLVLLYAAYWVGAWLLGPRYYFAALPGLAIYTASGILFAAGWTLDRGIARIPSPGEWQYARFISTAAVVLLLVGVNLRFYLPYRLGSLRGLYSIDRAALQPFTDRETRQLAPALIIVHADRWMNYANYLELTTPYFDTPFLFAWSIGPKTDAKLFQVYGEERAVYHYYPEQPWKFYTAPRSGSY